MVGCGLVRSLVGRLGAVQGLGVALLGARDLGGVSRGAGLVEAVLRGDQGLGGGLLTATGLCQVARGGGDLLLGGGERLTGGGGLLLETGGGLAERVGEGVGDVSAGGGGGLLEGVGEGTSRLIAGCGHLRLNVSVDLLEEALHGGDNVDEDGACLEACHGAPPPLMSCVVPHGAGYSSAQGVRTAMTSFAAARVWEVRISSTTAVTTGTGRG